MGLPVDDVGDQLGADVRPCKFKAVEVLTVEGGLAHFDDGEPDHPVVVIGYGDRDAATWDMAIALSDACDLFHRLGKIIFQFREAGHLPAVQ